VEKYSKNVQELISSHSAMGYNMSWKTSCAAFRLDFFPDNVRAISDEHGERFHQDISQIEKRYIGKWESKYIG
jgi:hypothetical protein